MFKNTILISAGIFLLFFGRTVSAEVEINEVEINPPEGRFVELYNSGNSTVDLTNWYIQRKTSASGAFGSFITKNDFTGKVINPNGYFLISRSQLPNSNLVISDMTLSESNILQLKNTNGDVVDKIGWGNCGESYCAPNPADGSSIQRQSSNTWLVASASPGATNNIVANTNTTSDTASGGVITLESSTLATSQKVAEIPAIKAKIGAPAYAFAGAPVKFSASASGYSGETLYDGAYFWNFGDGSSTETKANSPEKISHIFYYPGEYLISLGYYRNYFALEPDAMDKIALKVVPAGVSISRTGDEKDFFIELSNDADYDADISGWMLLSDAHKFVFPKNTILVANKKMILPPQITYFDISDKESLRLVDNNWKTVFDFAGFSEPVRISTKHKTEVKDFFDADKDMQNAPEDPGIPMQSLGANASSGTGDSSSAFYWLGLAGFLAIASFGAYFIRRFGRASLSKNFPGNDFEIIDE